MNSFKKPNDKTGGIKVNNLFDVVDLSKDEIMSILKKAKHFKTKIVNENKSFNNLKGKTVVLAFFENSTRTKCSFELAAKYLGANTTILTSTGSSVLKGETLIDTVRTLDYMASDAIVIRHSQSGAPYFIANHVKSKILNAGDGLHAHPTQALLDMLTIYERKEFQNLKVAIVGDILHSRVARSDIHILRKLGADIRVCGPKTLVPKEINHMGVSVFYDLKKALKDCDVIIDLRIQLERQDSGFFPSTGEYFRFFGIKEEALKYASKDCIVMHPGPVNRGVEISSGIIQSERCLVDEQVLSGVSVRMAVLDMMLGGEN